MSYAPNGADTWFTEYKLWRKASSQWFTCDDPMEWM